MFTAGELYISLGRVHACSLRWSLLGITCFQQVQPFLVALHELDVERFPVKRCLFPGQYDIIHSNRSMIFRTFLSVNLNLYTGKIFWC